MSCCFRQRIPTLFLLLLQRLDVENDGIDLVIFQNSQVRGHPDTRFFGFEALGDPSSWIENGFPEIGFVDRLDE